MKRITPYDNLAIRMAIEEKVYRLCEPFIGEGKPLHSDACNATKRALRELAKSDPNKVMDACIGGYCEDASHAEVDKAAEKRFGRKVMTDSESGSLHIYCSKANSKAVMGFLKKAFDDITLYAKSDKRTPNVQGLENWDAASKWVKKRGLSSHVIVDERTKKRMIHAME